MVKIVQLGISLISYRWIHGFSSGPYGQTRWCSVCTSLSAFCTSTVSDWGDASVSCSLVVTGDRTYVIYLIRSGSSEFPHEWSRWGCDSLEFLPLSLGFVPVGMREGKGGLSYGLHCSSRQVSCVCCMWIFINRSSSTLYGGSDHVTLIGNARAGMGYRNEFQAENYGPLTNHALIPCGVCSFSSWHVERMSMLKFADIL